ncbi:hypothetical protein [Halovivax gelatinilyticus]|uniref:hypothetical protein n=1 Tax=Halovivax gelatinilyticus TaxID=2961597 RepID=UPI0020CA786E|nr:hypothetical protein [Halovivax gelatinilyticus]
MSGENYDTNGSTRRTVLKASAGVPIGVGVLGSPVQASTSESNSEECSLRTIYVDKETGIEYLKLESDTETLLYLHDKEKRSISIVREDKNKEIYEEIMAYAVDDKPLKLEPIDVKEINNLDSIIEEYVTFNERFEGCSIPYISHYQIGAGVVLGDGLENYSATALGGALCAVIPYAGTIVRMLFGGACATLARLLQENLEGRRVAFAVWDDHQSWTRFPVIRAGVVDRSFIGENEIPVDVFMRKVTAPGHTAQDIL